MAGGCTLDDLAKLLASKSELDLAATLQAMALGVAPWVLSCQTQEPVASQVDKETMLLLGRV